jgi:hypothetical protein
MYVYLFWTLSKRNCENEVILNLFNLIPFFSFCFFFLKCKYSTKVTKIWRNLQIYLKLLSRFKLFLEISSYFCGLLGIYEHTRSRKEENKDLKLLKKPKWSLIWAKFTSSSSLRKQKSICLSWITKGQIKSEWIYEVIDFPNYQLKHLKDFCPESYEVEYL